MDAKTQQSAQAASVLAFPTAKPRTGARARSGANQQVLLDTVLSNMSQGVLMFDADARLVFCNQRYIEMYGLSPAVVTPGCALRDLLAASIRHLPQHLEAARAGHQDAGQHLDRRRLPGAIGTETADHLPAIDRERDVAHRLNRTIVTPDQRRDGAEPARAMLRDPKGLLETFHFDDRRLDYGRLYHGRPIGNQEPVL